MTEKLQHFFRKYSVNIADIMYMTREEGKSVLWLLDGRRVETFIPLKELASALTSRDFLCINKGIYVSMGQIRSADGGIYEMQDGRVFAGRKRAGKKALESQFSSRFPEHASPSEGIRRQFSVLDDMPEAFCVIELVINSDGKGVDFIFRYCNQEMEILEGKSIEQMQDQSFYRVFPNADRKWLVVYADVAINGNRRVFRSYSPEIGKELIIRCYQPAEGFCACLLSCPGEIPKEEAPMLNMA